MKLHEYQAKAVLSQYGVAVLGCEGIVQADCLLAALASAKVRALSEAGATIAPMPSDIGATVRKVLRKGIGNQRYACLMKASVPGGAG